MTRDLELPDDACAVCGSPGCGSVMVNDSDEARAEHEPPYPPAESEPCSCEEALTLREELARARGAAVHMSKADGYWTIELWLGGDLQERYAGERNAFAALERAGGFIRRIELQVNVTGKAEQR